MHVKVTVEAGVYQEVEIVQTWVCHCRIHFQDSVFHGVILIDQGLLVEDVNGVYEGVDTCSSGQQNDFAGFFFVQGETCSLGTANVDGGIEVVGDKIGCEVAITISFHE